MAGRIIAPPSMWKTFSRRSNSRDSMRTTLRSTRDEPGASAGSSSCRGWLAGVAGFATGPVQSSSSCGVVVVLPHRSMSVYGDRARPGSRSPKRRVAVATCRAVMLSPVTRRWAAR